MFRNAMLYFHEKRRVERSDRRDAQTTSFSANSRFRNRLQILCETKTVETNTRSNVEACPGKKTVAIG